jgi:hypothetical protein
VHQALTQRARKAGQEVADYAADALTRDVMGDLAAINPDEARRVQAELEVKAAALEFAVKEAGREGTVPPDITLRTFRHIRRDEHLSGLFSRAIGNRPGDDRGNWTKARINRNLGAAIKTAVGAVSKTIDGNPVTVQVTGEFIRSYTPLEPGPAKQ